MKTQRFVELLSSDDLLVKLQKQCVSILKAEGLLSPSETMSTTQLLKSFLFAKTLCNGGTPIEFNNSYPISVDTSLANNKLNQELPMSWGNLVCRYGYKFGWKVFGHRGMQYLDTALTGNPVGADAIASEKINEVTREIEARIRLLQNTL